MKTKKENTVLQQLRAIRDKVNSEIKDLNFEQLADYLNKQKTLHPKSNWQKSDRQRRAASHP